MGDQVYYRNRVLQEDEAAKKATCTEARDRHEELAAAYRLRCSVMKALPLAAGEPIAARSHGLTGVIEAV